ncbi:hydrogenase maturation protease [Raineyella fluvialis]|uniref:Hydrogenase maturation protease n=1 Tax=Raineyella fluvialis TaxID=2662261 RepID=A0A5Q2F881_9ACTN|nr:hydrogenase maturation protease [Raineyella fluvialis]QGF23102.1 hydrogenase maturation protease [Raineyella fluvialis]
MIPAGAGAIGATVVLGVGNPIMGDDGVGLALLDALREARGGGTSDAESGGVRVEYVDGGTGGMSLLPLVEEADRLLVLDAVAGPVPGTVVHLAGDQVPRMLSTKLSPHQVGLLDVFAAARLLGREPSIVEVIGVVPESVDLRLGLSPAVAAAVPEAVRWAERLLDQWLPAGLGAQSHDG